MKEAATMARYRAEIAEYKRVIRLNRKQLRSVSASLAALRECNLRGISFSVAKTSQEEK